MLGGNTDWKNWEGILGGNTGRDGSQLSATTALGSSLNQVLSLNSTEPDPDPGSDPEPEPDLDSKPAPDPGSDPEPEPGEPDSKLDPAPDPGPGPGPGLGLVHSVGTESPQMCCDSNQDTRTQQRRRARRLCRILLRLRRRIFQEREETYPGTKSGRLRTSRPGIPHTHAGWKQSADAASTLAPPTRECRRGQAAPSAHTAAQQPGRHRHGTRESASTRCCSRSPV